MDPFDRQQTAPVWHRVMAYRETTYSQEAMLLEQIRLEHDTICRLRYLSKRLRGTPARQLYTMAEHRKRRLPLLREQYNQMTGIFPPELAALPASDLPLQQQLTICYERTVDFAQTYADMARKYPENMRLYQQFAAQDLRFGQLLWRFCGRKKSAGWRPSGK